MKNLGKTKGAVAGIQEIRNHDGAAHGESSKILRFPEIIKKRWKIKGKSKANTILSYGYLATRIPTSTTYVGIPSNTYQ